MNNYSKNENATNAKQEGGNRNIIKCHWTNRPNTHIVRLNDPSITHYRVDDSMNTFKLLIAKE